MKNGVRGVSFRGTATPGDGGRGLELGVVGDAKRKAEALYYATLEVCTRKRERKEGRKESTEERHSISEV